MTDILMSEQPASTHEVFIQESQEKVFRFVFWVHLFDLMKLTLSEQPFNYFIHVF